MYEDEEFVDFANAYTEGSPTDDDEIYTDEDESSSDDGEDILLGVEIIDLNDDSDDSDSDDEDEGPLMSELSLGPPAGLLEPINLNNPDIFANRTPITVPLSLPPKPPVFALPNISAGLAGVPSLPPLPTTISKVPSLPPVPTTISKVPSLPPLPTTISKVPSLPPVPATRTQTVALAPVISAEELNMLMEKMPGISVTSVVENVAPDINDLLQKEVDETDEDYEFRKILTKKLITIPDYQLSNAAGMVAALLLMKKAKLGVTYDEHIESSLTYLVGLLQRD